jgi:peptidoglycan/LPS O-acetylase OafA/YrhL
VPQRHRFYILDGLRGIAAVLVVLFHVPLVLRPWLPDFNGWLAVDFFFCLSGFVIAFSYEEKLRSGMSFGRFLIIRLIRLYPLYFFGLLLGVASVLVSAHSGFLAGKVSLREIVLMSLVGLVLAPNFVVHWPIPCYFPLDAPAWSLCFEILANVAFAVLLRLRLTSTAFFACLSVLCFGLWVYGAHALGLSLDLGYFTPTFFLGLARAGGSFCLGVLVFRLHNYTRRAGGAGQQGWVWPAIITMVLIGALLNPFSFSSSSLYQIVVVAVLFPVIVLLGARNTLPERFSKACSVLGDLSYPLYILHFPILWSLTCRRIQTFLPRHGIPSIVVILPLCVALIIMAHIAGKVDGSIRRKLTALTRPRHQNVPLPLVASLVPAD